MKKILLIYLVFIIELVFLLPIITITIDIFFDIMGGNALTANRNIDQLIFAISFCASVIIGRAWLKTFDKIYREIVNKNKDDENK